MPTTTGLPGLPPEGVTPSRLRRARQARQLELDDVAAGLVRVLELPDGVCLTVRQCYQDLEQGRLDPADVAATVWAALARLLAAPGAPTATARTDGIDHAGDALGRAITDYSIAHRREPLGAAAVEQLFGVVAP